MFFSTPLSSLLLYFLLSLYWVVWWLISPSITATTTDSFFSFILLSSFSIGILLLLKFFCWTRLFTIGPVPAWHWTATRWHWSNTRFEWRRFSNWEVIAICQIFSSSCRTSACLVGPRFFFSVDEELRRQVRLIHFRWQAALLAPFRSDKLTKFGCGQPSSVELRPHACLLPILERDKRNKSTTKKSKKTGVYILNDRRH